MSEIVRSIIFLVNPTHQELQIQLVSSTTSLRNLAEPFWAINGSKFSEKVCSNCQISNYFESEKKCQFVIPTSKMWVQNNMLLGHEMDHFRDTLSSKTNFFPFFGLLHSVKVIDNDFSKNFKKKHVNSQCRYNVHSWLLSAFEPKNTMRNFEDDESCTDNFGPL